MKYFNPKYVFSFFADLFKSRWLILQLTKRDFKSKYLGSFLGIVWAFVQPTVTILILWFVFSIGFRSQPMDDFPFFLWLSAGMIPWFFFSDGIINASNCIVEFSYLIKNLVFRASILPIVKVLSALIVHIFFVFLLVLLFLIYGFGFQIYYIQLLYYLFALIIFILGVSWITSALVVFIKDVSQVLLVIVQLGFWVTPIFWTIDMLPENWRFLIKLNPVFYIVNGYRDSLIYRTWFWERPNLTIYFWSLTLVLWVVGTIVFKRLRPQFADVI